MQVNADNRSELIRLTNQVVNQVFYGTLLREFREAQENPFMGGGPGGQTFVRQLDMAIIERISGSKPSGVAEQLFKELDQAAQAERWRQEGQVRMQAMKIRNDTDA